MVDVLGKTGDRYSRVDEQGAVIVPPRSKQNMMRAFRPAGESVPVPSWALGRWCSLVAVGGTGYWMTSPEDGAPINISESVVSGGKVTADPKIPFPLIEGGIVPYYFEPNTDRFIVIMGDTGQWFMSVSSPDRAGR